MGLWDGIGWISDYPGRKDSIAWMKGSLLENQVPWEVVDGYIFSREMSSAWVGGGCPDTREETGDDERRRMEQREGDEGREWRGGMRDE